MKIKNLCVSKYRDGDEKILSLTTETSDGRKLTADYTLEEAVGLCIWMISKSEDLDNTPLEELTILPTTEEYRIMG